ncbi:hypothetical protein SCHPADRAFT_923138 [Schizopora paradoxa]|uniref:AAAP amino acid permease n=1 Tax=Schizopora paradoxa TaxID=27342 RepID=A0A0H2R5K0_9AGAM|nr:hypothetical protein SCHPADRAFT_923138 [Schizopora paradoxa]
MKVEENISNFPEVLGTSSLNRDAAVSHLATIEEGRMNDASSIHPPSFSESQFDVILRRQRPRSRKHNGLKVTATPSRFVHACDHFEFAGWGSVSYLDLTPEDISFGEAKCKIVAEAPTVGPWTASAVAANDVCGSVFYAFPAVVAVAGVYSPVSLFIATLILFLWRPIMEELSSAFRAGGANYTFLVNVTSKTLALAGGAITLLDYAMTVVISASTTSEYIAGEVTLPFPVYVGALLIVAVPLLVSLLGMKESARTALGILSFHMITMLTLSIMAIITWAKRGNGQIRENWNAGHSPSSRHIVAQVFNGVCIGMLGITGFECSPDYVITVRRGQFPKVLRNLHLPVIPLYSILMLLVLAILPIQTVNGGLNVLSILAQETGGEWLRILVIIDACVVLSAGVLTGILSACALCERLANDKIIPGVFLFRMPYTDAQIVAITAFVLLSGVLYGSAGANQRIISSVFALTWLTVMGLFPLSLLLLKFNRGRVPRQRRVSLSWTALTLAITVVVFVGNVAMDPKTVGYFSAYAVGIVFFFFVNSNKVQIIRYIYWAYDQTPLLHQWSWARRMSSIFMRLLTSLRQQPVCVLAKCDEIHHLFRMVMYVKKNEQASCLKLVHLYENVEDIPSEIEANAKLLDEAFPEITVDLVFVQAPFTPPVVAALAHKLDIPRSLMFMSSPGPESNILLEDYGTRIISL